MEGEHDPDFDMDEPANQAAAGTEMLAEEADGAAMPKAKKKRKKRNNKDPTKTGDSANPEGGLPASSS